jgi:hypothetical protein
VTDILPVPPPSEYIATSGRRALAAEMINTAGGAITDGLYATELLDLIAGVVLRLAGRDDAAARAVVAALWVEPTGGDR